MLFEEKNILMLTKWVIESMVVDGHEEIRLDVLTVSEFIFV